ncbi:putative acetyltransferase [Cellulosimicrobium cellulans]|uniref:putative acetyltransferase n=1 Tax=Cellulosimicrobium cellulans TaxID=1710 RepID=UPI0008483EAA|nr:hypothetical protein [Cellulosimicrobium cellulans]
MTREQGRRAPGASGAGREDAPRDPWSPGTRVVVRRRLTDAEAAASGRTLTDVIGVVVSVTSEEVTLREDAGGSVPHRGHGPRDPEPAFVVVPRAAIVAAKAVPPRPPRRPA